MNILNIKVKHPTKGQLELGRWSKSDLASMSMELLQQRDELLLKFKDYILRYGFHSE